MLQQSVSPVIVKEKQERQIWSPPPLNHFKLNMDAAFNLDTSEFAMGLIIRDCTGQSFAVKGRYFHGGIDCEQAECLAMKEAILWANECNLNNVILESDNLNVINSIKQTTSSVHWMNQGIIDDIKFFLSSSPNFVVNHVKISANSVAHSIAKKASSDRTYFDYTCNIPEDISKLVWAEQHSVTISYVN
ncbi:uncharacterized protein LOC113279951 [Papaver somniferum]|uniref:uncharacterized protein LOC113279951 n=1 Tax=Papaver somniferum TaxID=3469 RepID=UPI000E6FEBD9|nr:uncharacterized protein LOC113279951 [Papaver somniferum]